MSLRPLGTPRPAVVAVDRAGRPTAVAERGRRRRVEQVRDRWRVQDRWWTDRPVDRHYHELALEGGALVTIYREVPSGRWFIQG